MCCLLTKATWLVLRRLVKSHYTLESVTCNRYYLFALLMLVVIFCSREGGHPFIFAGLCWHTFPFRVDRVPSVCLVVCYSAPAELFLAPMISLREHEQVLIRDRIPLKMTDIDLSTVVTTSLWKHPMIFLEACRPRCWSAEGGISLLGLFFLHEQAALGCVYWVSWDTRYISLETQLYSWRWYFNKVG